MSVPYPWTPEVEAERQAALSKITDPLWRAIARGDKPETDRLMRELRQLVDKDRVWRLARGRKSS